VKISVIINNYNYGRFLPRAIRSVLNQTSVNLDLILVDDASSDGSREILKQWQDHATVIEHSQNEGQAAAFSTGIQAACGDLICFLDADDTWEPGKCAAMLEAWTAAPHILWAAHPLRLVDARAETDLGLDPPHLASGPVDWRHLRYPWSRLPTLPATSGLAFRTDFLRRLLPLPRLRISADIFLKCAAVSAGPGWLDPTPHGTLWLHGQNSWTGIEDTQPDKLVGSIAVALAVLDRIPQMKWWARKHLAGCLRLLREAGCPERALTSPGWHQLPSHERLWCHSLASLMHLRQILSRS